MNTSGGIDAVDTSVTLTDSTGFPTSGTIQIGSEQLTYTGNAAHVLSGLVRGANNTTAASHTDATSVGQVYDSGFHTLAQFTQVQTEIVSSTDGTLQIDFTSDVNGTDVVRALAIPFLSANGYQLYGAPVFAPYVRYRFVNTESVNQTDFFYSSLKLTTPINAQVLTVAAPIVSSMVVNLGRNIVVGQQPDGDFVNQPADGNAFEYTNATFAADAEYTSAWFDTDGYNMIELFVASDQVGATGGFIIEFTNNTNAGTPLVNATRTFTFNQYDVDEAFKLLNLITLLDGFRVRYMNGNTQANITLVATLKINGSTTNFDKSGSIQVTDFTTSVALGSISNFKTGSIDGRNGDTTAGGEDLIGAGGIYGGFPTSTTPVTIQVSSTSANDAGPSGTGARTVQIQGLATSTSSEYTIETFTMNGTTAVTGGTWWRVTRAQVMTVGSGGTNAGTITVEISGGGGAIYGTILSGEDATTAGIYTVPAGHKMMIKHLVVVQARTNGASGSAEVTLRTRSSTGTNGNFHPLKRFSLQTGMALDLLFQGGVIVDELMDVKVRCDNVSGTSDVCCDIEFLLITK